MYIKIHKSYRNVVAICDAELIGKKFEEVFSPNQESSQTSEKLRNKNESNSQVIRQLDCRENFYKDKLVTKEEAIKILKLQSSEDSTFNIIGKKSIQTCIEAKIISQNNIDYIDNIPFSLILI